MMITQHPQLFTTIALDRNFALREDAADGGGDEQTASSTALKAADRHRSCGFNSHLLRTSVERHYHPIPLCMSMPCHGAPKSTPLMRQVNNREAFPFRRTNGGAPSTGCGNLHATSPRRRSPCLQKARHRGE